MPEWLTTQPSRIFLPAAAIIQGGLALLLISESVTTLPKYRRAQQRAAVDLSSLDHEQPRSVRGERLTCTPSTSCALRNCCARGSGVTLRIERRQMRVPDCGGKAG